MFQHRACTRLRFSSRGTEVDTGCKTRAADGYPRAARAGTFDQPE